MSPERPRLSISLRVGVVVLVLLLVIGVLGAASLFDGLTRIRVGFGWTGCSFATGHCEGEVGYVSQQLPLDRFELGILEGPNLVAGPRVLGANVTLTGGDAVATFMDRGRAGYLDVGDYLRLEAGCGDVGLAIFWAASHAELDRASTRFC